MMKDDDSIELKLKSLLQRTEKVNRERAEAKGQLAVWKRRLQDLMDEIRSEGYDPQTLVDERDRARAQLLKEMEVYEKELTEAETALAVFQNPSP